MLTTLYIPAPGVGRRLCCLILDFAIWQDVELDGSGIKGSDSNVEKIQQIEAETNLFIFVPARVSANLSRNF